MCPTCPLVARTGFETATLMPPSMPGPLRRLAPHPTENPAVAGSSLSSSGRTRTYNPPVNRKTRGAAHPQSGTPRGPLRRASIRSGRARQDVRDAPRTPPIGLQSTPDPAPRSLPSGGASRRLGATRRGNTCRRRGSARPRIRHAGTRVNVNCVRFVREPRLHPHSSFRAFYPSARLQRAQRGKIKRVHVRRCRQGGRRGLHCCRARGEWRHILSAHRAGAGSAPSTR